MIIIGESIHVIAKPVSDAIKSRDPLPIQELAIAQTKAGAGYIDLNLGPARRDPEATMQWLVNTIQEVSDLPLSLDTLNPIAMEAGLKICKKRPLLNSVSGQSESKEIMLPLAKKYGCDVVISVLNDKGCPPDIDSRVESIMETVAVANEMGIPNEFIWVDPILLPVSADQGQVKEALEFIKILREILPGIKSTIGLSNVSNGTPENLRGILNRTYMLMLGKYGMHSVIADALDLELMNTNKGESPHVVNLINRILDGEEVDFNALSERKRNYYKTTKVLLGEMLYSHAWLES
jgi:cobalamin-dependent methionine synthase I